MDEEIYCFWRRNILLHCCNQNCYILNKRKYLSSILRFVATYWKTGVNARPFNIYITWFIHFLLFSLLRSSILKTSFATYRTEVVVTGTFKKREGKRKWHKELNTIFHQSKVKKGLFSFFLIALWEIYSYRLLVRVIIGGWYF